MMAVSVILSSLSACLWKMAGVAGVAGVAGGGNVPLGALLGAPSPFTQPLYK